MLSGHITQTALGLLDRITTKKTDAQATPAHLRTGGRGEEDAYFYLRRRGYVMIARNFRTAGHHGEIDWIGWDKDVLCFVEVKTRTTRDVKPAAAAVDRKKRHDLRVVIRDYLRSLPERQFPELPQCDSTWSRSITKRSQAPSPAKSATTGDPLTVHPTFELFQNAARSS